MTIPKWANRLDDERDYTKALIYGREGTGKTSAAAAASRLGPVLIIDSEGGLKKQALADRGANVANLAVWPPRGQRVTNEGLKTVHEQLLDDLTKDPDSWAAVVVDSLTEVHHLLREDATDQRVAKSRVAIDEDFVDRDDYGKMTNQMRRWIRRMRDLPTHVILIALEKLGDDDDRVRPGLTPALATDVMGYVDIVGRTAVHDGQFLARFQPTAQVHAKDRYGRLPALMLDPSFTRIQQVLSGELDPDEARVEIATEQNPPASGGGKKKTARKRRSETEQNHDKENISAEAE